MLKVIIYITLGSLMAGMLLPSVWASPVPLQKHEKIKIPVQDIIFLIDNSGSMDFKHYNPTGSELLPPNDPKLLRYRALAASIHALALNPRKDVAYRVGIISYATNTDVLWPLGDQVLPKGLIPLNLQKVWQNEEIGDIDRNHTNHAAALDTAIQLLQQYPITKTTTSLTMYPPVIIILTDGSVRTSGVDIKEPEHNPGMKIQLLKRRWGATVHVILLGDEPSRDIDTWEKWGAEVYVAERAENLTKFFRKIVDLAAGALEGGPTETPEKEPMPLKLDKDNPGRVVSFREIIKIPREKKWLVDSVIVTLVSSEPISNERVGLRLCYLKSDSENGWECDKEKVFSPREVLSIEDEYIVSWEIPADIVSDNVGIFAYLQSKYLKEKNPYAELGYLVTYIPIQIRLVQPSASDYISYVSGNVKVHLVAEVRNQNDIALDVPENALRVSAYYCLSESNEAVCSVQNSISVPLVQNKKVHYRFEGDIVLDKIHSGGKWLQIRVYANSRGINVGPLPEYAPFVALPIVTLPRVVRIITDPPTETFVGEPVSVDVIIESGDVHAENLRPFIVIKNENGSIIERKRLKFKSNDTLSLQEPIIFKKPGYYTIATEISGYLPSYGFSFGPGTQYSIPQQETHYHVVLNLPRVSRIWTDPPVMAEVGQPVTVTVSIDEGREGAEFEVYILLKTEDGQILRRLSTRYVTQNTWQVKEPIVFRAPGKYRLETEIVGRYPDLDLTFGPGGLYNIPSKYVDYEVKLTLPRFNKVAVSPPNQAEVGEPIRLSAILERGNEGSRSIVVKKVTVQFKREGESTVECQAELQPSETGVVWTSPPIQCKKAGHYQLVFMASGTAGFGTVEFGPNTSYVVSREIPYNLVMPLGFEVVGVQLDDSEEYQLERGKLSPLFVELKAGAGKPVTVEAWWTHTPEYKVQLHNDGISPDIDANDLVWSGYITAPLSTGVYTTAVQVVAQSKYGVLIEGVPYMVSIKVIPRWYDLSRIWKYIIGGVGLILIAGFVYWREQNKPRPMIGELVVRSGDGYLFGGSSVSEIFSLSEYTRPITIGFDKGVFNIPTPEGEEPGIKAILIGEKKRGRFKETVVRIKPYKGAHIRVNGRLVPKKGILLNDGYNIEIGEYNSVTIEYRREEGGGGMYSSFSY